MASKVYFTKEISPESLNRIFDALGVRLQGKVGVKISTGEPGGHNYLHPELIGSLVTRLKGTIIECCTAYGLSLIHISPLLIWRERTLYYKYLRIYS